jgi:tRNA(Ile)-lysidine synthase
MTVNTLPEGPFFEHLAAAMQGFGVGEERILVAVSGGADSTALLCSLAKLTPVDRLHVAHLDHGLRDDGPQEARWVRDLASLHGLAVTTDRVDTKGHASTRGVGLEEAARALRYGFLEEVAKRERCPFVALAHTADDQAETILHHIIRGTGLAGLKGIPHRRGLGEGLELIRPLLEVTRGEIEAFLQQIGQDPLQDASNRDEQFTRNRIRHTLLPLLESEFNSNIRSVLLKLSRQAADLDDVVAALVEGLLDEALADRTPTTIRLHRRDLARQPRHLVRECFRCLFREAAWPRRRMGFDDWDRLADLVHTPGAVTLPEGIDARTRGELIVLRRDAPS